tara:strand:+ start:437 stop:652 length:216 start_codon:yes stop_codon:yes gene_type:complete
MGKKAASWTIDEHILAWISQKLGSKSEYVNRILQQRMDAEQKMNVNRPKVCGECHSIRFIGNKCAHCGVEA